MAELYPLRGRSLATFSSILFTAMQTDLLLRIYRTMLTTRLFEARVVALNRQGRVSVYATGEGEEAIGASAGAAMAESDWLFPDYRSAAALFARGISPAEYLAQIMGTGEDSSKGRQMPTHVASRALRIASVSTPVGNSIVHAVGFAWAAKLRKGPEVALVLFGDGATSSDGFHAGMNIAGVHKLPVVFLCRNNQYAISLPLSLQTASKTLASKAEAYGFEGIQIDGTDAETVYAATNAAFEKARRSRGPTLIEAVSYRFGAHTTSDDARRYRTDQETNDWRNRDCVMKLRRRMQEAGLWNEEQERSLHQEIGHHLDQIVEAALSAPPPPVESLFTDVYAELPPYLCEQRDSLLRQLRKKGKSAS